MTVTINGSTGVDIGAGNLTFPDDTTQSTSPIGVDQTWQDVTASRAAGVSYTNSTGKPIQIFVQTGTAGLVITIGGLSTTSTGGVTNGQYFTSLIIPNGTSYSISLTPVKWFELR